MKSTPRLLPIVIAYLGLVSIGLRDGTLGVAWPSIRDSFTLPQSGLGLILLAAGSGYFLSSLSTGYLVRRLGVGMLLAASTFSLTLGLTGYALAGSWGLFLGSATLVGLGTGATEGGLNAYAASHFSGRHMNWMHASYGLGAMGGPLIMTGLLNQGASWRWGYLILAGYLLVLVATFSLTRHRWHPVGSVDGSPPSPAAGATGSSLHEPVVWFQIGLVFLYAGMEVTTGQWTYTLFTESRDLSVVTAGLLVSLYWASMTVGRLLFGLVIDRMSMTELLRWSMGATIVAALLIWVPFRAANFLGIILIGVALAPIFPCLMKQTPDRVGPRRAAQVVGFQMGTTMVGVIVIPGLTGLLAQLVTLEMVGAVLTVNALLLFALHEALLLQGDKQPLRARTGRMDQ